ncbi:hypothetical protein CLOM_g11647 [Closterium sp. NIES-68]|nr:hypothetical protein CLOM_g11647 [Closterium sp. NIES-68]
MGEGVEGGEWWEGEWHLGESVVEGPFAAALVTCINCSSLLQVHVPAALPTAAICTLFCGHCSALLALPPSARASTANATTTATATASVSLALPHHTGQQLEATNAGCGTRGGDRGMRGADVAPGLLPPAAGAALRAICGLRRMSEDPRERRMSEDPHERRMSEDPRERRMSEDPRERRMSEDPRERRMSEDPCERRMSEDPRERRMSEDPRERSACDGSPTSDSTGLAPTPSRVLPALHRGPAVPGGGAMRGSWAVAGEMRQQRMGHEAQFPCVQVTPCYPLRASALGEGVTAGPTTLGATSAEAAAATDGAGSGAASGAESRRAQRALRKRKLALSLTGSRAAAREGSEEAGDVSGEEESCKGGKQRGGKASSKAAGRGGMAPVKRHRKASTYNLFIRDEMLRLRAANPAMDHREAFKEAAKRWGSAAENVRGSHALAAAAKARALLLYPPLRALHTLCSPPPPVASALPAARVGAQEAVGMVEHLQPERVGAGCWHSGCGVGRGPRDDEGEGGCRADGVGYAPLEMGRQEGSLTNQQNQMQGGRPGCHMEQRHEQERDVLLPLAGEPAAAHPLEHYLWEAEGCEQQRQHQQQQQQPPPRAQLLHSDAYRRLAAGISNKLKSS